MKETIENHEGKDLKYQLLGWILFIACMVFFVPLFRTISVENIRGLLKLLVRVDRATEIG